MKETIKNILSIFALILLLTSIQNMIQTSEIHSTFVFEIELLFMTVLIFVGQYLLKRVELKYFAIEISIEFLMVSAVVLTCGLFFNWYTFPNFMHIYIVVIIVYVISFFLGIAKTRHDVSEVNSLLSQRKANLRS